MGDNGHQADVPVSVREVIDRQLVRIVYQPLYDLQTRRIYAYEALVRATIPDYPNPPALLRAAAEARLVGELGRLLRTLTVEGCPDFPLFINVHPSEFGEGWLVRPDDPIFSHEHPVYLEITESVPLTHFEWCHDVLAEVRAKDIRLAVDDLGAGYSNLKYIADLHPEVVKLDMSLVRDVDVRPRKLQLVAAIVRLCVDLGARVVAEGIETDAEFRAIVGSGAHLGQGYRIARPDAPPPGVTTNELPYEEDAG